MWDAYASKVHLKLKTESNALLRVISVENQVYFLKMLFKSKKLGKERKQ